MGPQTALCAVGYRNSWLLFLALSGFFFIGPPTWLIARFAPSGQGRYFLAYAIYVVLVLLLAWWWVKSRKQSLVVFATLIHTPLNTWPSRYLMG